MPYSLDANKYRINIENIKLILQEKTPKEKLEMIGVLAISTGVPIIIVCSYIGELFGFSEELDQKLKRLQTFYGIDEVQNVHRTNLYL